MCFLSSWSNLKWVLFKRQSDGCVSLTQASQDFSTDHAFSFLSRFRHRFRLFNDDIQGTGAVVLAGLISAARLPPLQTHEHRILFFGAGSAGVGVATQLLSFFTLSGMSEEEARNHIWLVDSKGLIYDGRAGVAEHKKGKSSR